MCTLHLRLLLALISSSPPIIQASQNRIDKDSSFPPPPVQPIQDDQGAPDAMRVQVKTPAILKENTTSSRNDNAKAWQTESPHENTISVLVNNALYTLQQMVDL